MVDLASQGQFAAANDAEWRFHVKIADVAELGLLRRTWTSVDDIGRLTTLQLAARYRSFPRYLSVLAERHRDLLAILARREPPKAADAGRQHLEAMHQVFLADIEDSERRTLGRHASSSRPSVVG